jgi:hypothetical protein
MDDQEFVEEVKKVLRKYDDGLITDDETVMKVMEIVLRKLEDDETNVGDGTMTNPEACK